MTAHPVRLSARLFAGVAALLVVAGCGASRADSRETTQPRTPLATASSRAGIDAKPVHGKLPKSTTMATIDGAARGDGGQLGSTVVHPRAALTVYSRDGDPFAVLPTHQLGSPTWVPVIDRKRGWVRVLLPSRPNGSSGWIRTGKLRTAHTRSRILINIDDRTLTLLRDGTRVGRWPVAVGKKGTPTPRGRTFVLAAVIDSEQLKYTPILMPLGTHSATLDTFGGGPGTVAIHGWPDTSVFGHAVSHGCVRVPSAALDELRRVPLGSPVIIR